MRKISNSTIYKKTLKMITFVVDSKEIWHLIKFDFEISTLFITQSNVMFILLSSDAVLFSSFWFEIVSIVGAFYLFHRSHFFGNFSSSFAENFNINTYFAPSVFHVRIWCRASYRVVKSVRKSNKMNCKEKQINPQAHIIVCWF